MDSGGPPGQISNLSKVRTESVTLMSSRSVAKWRNWQTHQTQNLAYFTVRVGSTPTFATNKTNDLAGKGPPIWSGLFFHRTVNRYDDLGHTLRTAISL